MATNNNIDKAFGKVIKELNDIQRKQLPPILAEKSTAFFKSSFRKKGWNGILWNPAKNPPKKGSLMVRTGHLMNSIQPKTITPEKVVISAGNSRVPYAKIQNEGGTIRHPGGERKLTFKKYKRGKHKGRTLFSKNNKKASFGKKINVGPYDIKIPKRQFMGNSPALKKQLIKDIENAFKDV